MKFCIGSLVTQKLRFQIKIVEDPPLSCNMIDESEQTHTFSQVNKNLPLPTSHHSLPGICTVNVYIMFEVVPTIFKKILIIEADKLSGI
jgi:hypothetical protein